MHAYTQSQMGERQGIWTERTSCDYRKKGKQVIWCFTPSQPSQLSQGVKKGKCETEFHSCEKCCEKEVGFVTAFEKRKGWNLYYVRWQLPGAVVITGVKWEEHTCIHIHTYLHIGHTCTHTHTHTHTHACMHTWTFTHTHARTHTLRMHTHTHMNMHTHTHAPNVSLESTHLFLLTSWRRRENGLTHSRWRSLWSGNEQSENRHIFHGAGKLLLTTQPLSGITCLTYNPAKLGQLCVGKRQAEAGHSWRWVK